MQKSRCEQCKHYAKLEEPFRYEKEGYPDGVTVFGFCAKEVKRLFNFYPVYLPGGVCKTFSRRHGAKFEHPQLERQLILEGMK